MCNGHRMYLKGGCLGLGLIGLDVQAALTHICSGCGAGLAELRPLICSTNRMVHVTMHTLIFVSHIEHSGQCDLGSECRLTVV